MKDSRYPSDSPPLSVRHEGVMSPEIKTTFLDDVYMNQTQNVDILQSQNGRLEKLLSKLRGNKDIGDEKLNVEPSNISDKFKSIQSEMVYELKDLDFLIAELETWI